MGTNLRVLCEGFPMNTEMAGFGWFKKYLQPCALDESSHSIWRVNVPLDQLIKSIDLPLRL